MFPMKKTTILLILGLLVLLVATSCARGGDTLPEQFSESTTTSICRGGMWS